MVSVRELILKSMCASYDNDYTFKVNVDWNECASSVCCSFPSHPIPSQPSPAQPSPPQPVPDPLDFD